MAREKRFPERAWRGATATDVAELRAWMLARHSRRHSDELEHWIGAIADWQPLPDLSHHKLRWFRSVLLRFGPPGRHWEEEPEAPDTTYRRLVRAIRTAHIRRRNEKKRSPAPPRTSYSHPTGATDPTVPGPSSHRNGSRSRSRSGSARSHTNGSASRAVADPAAPPPEPPRRLQTPPHW